MTPTIGAQALGTDQEVGYEFIDVSNTNTDNTVVEYITITYDAVVLNTSDNNDGDIKTEEVQADYNAGSTVLTARPVRVTLVEPDVSIDLSSIYTFGNEVTYIYTIENTGTAPAYDIDIDTLLPTGLSFSGSSIVTNSGGVVGLTQSGEDFSFDELPVNT